MNQTRLRIVLAAAALAALAFVDPLYIPLVSLGPLLTGLVAGLRGADWRPPAATWAIAGALVLIIDLAVNGEDAAFHAVVMLLTVGLVRLGAAAGGLGYRRGLRAA